jgi:hypothetical protein
MKHEEERLVRVDHEERLPMQPLASILLWTFTVSIVPPPDAPGLSGAASHWPATQPHLTGRHRDLIEYDRQALNGIRIIYRARVWPLDRDWLVKAGLDARLSVWGEVELTEMDRNGRQRTLWRFSGPTTHSFHTLAVHVDGEHFFLVYPVLDSWIVCLRRTVGSEDIVVPDEREPHRLRVVSSDGPRENWQYQQLRKNSSFTPFTNATVKARFSGDAPGGELSLVIEGEWGRDRFVLNRDAGPNEPAWVSVPTTQPTDAERAALKASGRLGIPTWKGP